MIFILQIVPDSFESKYLFVIAVLGCVPVPVAGGPAQRQIIRDLLVAVVALHQTRQVVHVSLQTFTIGLVSRGVGVSLAE
jgi:hypothetical protein